MRAAATSATKLGFNFPHIMELSLIFVAISFSFVFRFFSIFFYFYVFFLRMLPPETYLHSTLLGSAIGCTARNHHIYVYNNELVQLIPIDFQIYVVKHYILWVVKHFVFCISYILTILQYITDSHVYEANLEKLLYVYVTA